MFLRSVMQLLSLSLLAIWAIAQPYDYGIDIESLTRRDSDARILVGRLPLYPDGSAPRRLEIRQMAKDSHKWDLFILSLSMFQYVSQSDPMSWYQVAGIHGVPFRTWNGVDPVDGGDQAGYCTHSSVLFPTWHRPYLALVEQEMFRMANFIAGMFPNSTERKQYQRAAADMRFPYWDWSIPAPPEETHFPDVFWHPTIMQYGPRGIQSIRNPLYAYPFHPLEEEAMIWQPMRSWAETKRAPATNLSLSSPPSNNKKVDEALRAKLPEIQQRLLILFSSYKDFNAFSNKAWAVSQNLSSWDSIESVHDIVHIYGGLKGHMTYVPLSSFDPLFFLHHMSTDRLFAMWQILNPDAWIHPMPAGESSYTSTQGTLQTAETELKPFYISNNTFWTSDMARTTEIFGYTYADTDAYGVTEDELRLRLTRKINDWWGESSVVGLSAKSHSSNGLYPHIVTDVTAAFNLKGFRPNMKNDLHTIPETVIKSGRYTEWIANVHVNTEAMDASYAVHFFFGDAPSHCEWATANNEVGSVAIFAMNHGSGSKAKISGTLPLTSSLLKMVAAGTIPHLHPGEVESFLRQALEFRICDINDDEVDPTTVEGLFVGISSAEVSIPYTKDELPKWDASIARIELWA